MEIRGGTEGIMVNPLISPSYAQIKTLSTGILLTLPPRQAANVLNGKQDVVIRKTVPQQCLGRPIPVAICCPSGQPLTAAILTAAWVGNEHVDLSDVIFSDRYGADVEEEVRRRYPEAGWVAIRYADVSGMVLGFCELRNAPLVQPTQDAKSYFAGPMNRHDLEQRSLMSAMEIRGYRAGGTVYAWTLGGIHPFIEAVSIQEYTHGLARKCPKQWRYL